MNMGRQLPLQPDRDFVFRENQDWIYVALSGRSRSGVYLFT